MCRAAATGEAGDSRAQAYVKVVDLTDDADRKPADLSGGQRQRMALADRVAVMRAGRFEQGAPSATIYAPPASEAVARYIGRSAVVDARVPAVSGASARVAVAGVETRRSRCRSFQSLRPPDRRHRHLVTRRQKRQDGP